MKKNRRLSKDNTRILPGNRMGERVVKGRPNWKKKNQLKRLKIIMTAVLVILALSVTAGAILIWMEFERSGWPEIFPAAESTVSEISSEPESSVAPEDSALEEDNGEFALILVNKDHSVPENLEVEPEEFNGVQVDSRIVPYLQELYQAAEQAGLSLKAVRGYEDEQVQEQYIQQEASRLESEEGLTALRAQDRARTAFEESGEQEFRTGLAIEFTAVDLAEGAAFDSTPEYQWLLSHGVEYGLIQRYPRNKEDETGVPFSAAHFRYVGAENAMKMRELNMCLEEYVQYLNEQSQG